MDVRFSQIRLMCLLRCSRTFLFQFVSTVTYTRVLECEPAGVRGINPLSYPFEAPDVNCLRLSLTKDVQDLCREIVSRDDDEGLK